jgi:hypothetical protein
MISKSTSKTEETGKMRLRKRNAGRGGFAFAKQKTVEEARDVVDVFSFFVASFVHVNASLPTLNKILNDLTLNNNPLHRSSFNSVIFP